MGAASLTQRLLVAIYLRVSTEEQAHKGFSLPEQLEACQRKARELAGQRERTAGQKIDLQTKVFTDDFGGDILERPALEELRHWIRLHHPDYFVCLDPDRFSRSLKLQLIVADEIESSGSRLAFVQQEYDPSDISSRAFFQFRGLMAEMEKAKIIERTTRGKRGKLKAGGRPNGAAPYGYHHNKERDQLEIDETQAKWVRQLFHWIADEGFTITQACQRLNDLGVPTRRGKGRWYRAVVRGILHNTSYVGQMRCNRRNFKGLFAIRRLPRERRQPLTAKERPAQEWITVAVPSIIDQSLFDRAHARLKRATRHGRRRDAGLLSLIVRCGECGAPMVYARHAPHRTYLRCRNKYPVQYDVMERRKPCSNPHQRADRIENEVWQALIQTMTNPACAMLAQYAGQRGTDGAAKARIARLEADRTILRQQLHQKKAEQRLVIHEQLRGNLSPPVAEEMLRGAMQAARHIELRLGEVADHLSALQSQPAMDQLRTTTAIAERYRDAMAALPDNLKRELLIEAFDSITVYRDGSWKARYRAFS